MNEEADTEALKARYLEASAATSGLPSNAVRQAILDEARAAALRRMPAANDKQYWWRAVAGIAVVGIALALWRDGKQIPEAPVKAADNVAIPTPAAPAPVRSAPSSTLAPLPSVAASAAAAKAAPAAARSRVPVQVALPTAEMEARATRMPALADSAAGVAPAASPAGAMQSRKEAGAATTVSVLQTYFPEVYVGEMPASSVWILLDSNGNLVRRGVLNASDTLADVTRVLERDYPGQLGNWQKTTARTEQGTAVEVTTTSLR
jgi:hypothetical protein